MTQNEGGTSDEEFRNAAVIDRVNTTYAVFMGTTMACAQCHTHKYDPITIDEYFRSYAFFNQSADSDKRDESPLHSFMTTEQKASRAELDGQVAALESKFAAPTPAWLEGQEKWEASVRLDAGWKAPLPASVTSEEDDRIRSLRNRVEEGHWLLLAETANGVEMPWISLQQAKPLAVVRLGDG